MVSINGMNDISIEPAEYKRVRLIRACDYVHTNS